MNASRKGIAISALPGVMLPVLFYSLAIHIYWALGGWPMSIGEHGFPPVLVIHSAVTIWVFGLLLVSLLFCPLPILICLLVERWQRFAVYIAVYAGVILLCFTLTQF